MRGREAEWGIRRGSERRRRHQTGRKFCPSLSVLSVRSHNKSTCSLVATTERRTAHQSTKTATWAVTRCHNIKTEKGMLEILSERQSIPSSNVYMVWNGSKWDGPDSARRGRNAPSLPLLPLLQEYAERPHDPC